MILDYSKINSFERDVQRASKNRKGSNPSALPAIPTSASSSTQMLNIYGNVDLAAITEECVESTTAGSLYQDLSQVNFSDTSASARGRTSDKGHAKNVDPMALPYALHATGAVEVILDIKCKENWIFVTQPGAFRRILMVTYPSTNRLISCAETICRTSFQTL
jgi:hypothetical protein